MYQLARMYNFMILELVFPISHKLYFRFFHYWRVNIILLYSLANQAQSQSPAFIHLLKRPMNMSDSKPKDTIISDFKECYSIKTKKQTWKQTIKVWKKSYEIAIAGLLTSLNRINRSLRSGHFVLKQLWENTSIWTKRGTKYI